MKNKKHLFITLILILLISFFVSVCTAFAHSGGTDSNGGHYNHSTGEYHYHHGESAHQHPNGRCPYDYWWVFLTISILGITLLYSWFTISNYLPHNIIHDFEKAMKEYYNSVNYSERCNNQLTEIKNNAIPPDGYEVGKDRLPKEINSSKWGESLTVYVARDGWKLHLQPHCCDFLFERHVYRFANKRHSFCKKCAESYQIPDLNWYNEYLKIEPQEKKCATAREKQNVALRNIQSCYNACNNKTANFFLFFSPNKKKIVNKIKQEYEQLPTILPTSTKW